MFAAPTQKSLLPPVDDPVREHYERWPYPPPIEDLSNFDFSAPDCRVRDLRELYWTYWPTAERYREDLDILVAGCGTSAAACYAYFYPTARVIGIDISAASLDCERRLQQRHNLTNLTLHQMPLEDAAALGRDFDFIVSHGVLLHLADPVVGLRSLKNLLRPDGVIAILVYSWYSKFGVYMLQDLFHRLGLKQDQAGIDLVKETLQRVGPSHPVQQHLRLASDLGTDTGILDCFLHRRDRAFTVGDCLNFVEESGLAFGGWDEPGFYHPEGQLPPDSALRREIEKLDEKELWKAMELFNGNIPGHWFFACRADRDSCAYRPDFGGDAFLNYIPVARSREVGGPGTQGHSNTLIARPPYPQLKLTPPQSVFYRQIDGRRTIAQMIANAGFTDPPEKIARFALDFFRNLYRVGYVTLRMPAPLSSH